MTVLATLSVCALLVVSALWLWRSSPRLAGDASPGGRAFAWRCSMPAVDLPGRTPVVIEPVESDWREASDLGKTEAEELLDWLEAHGRRQHELLDAPGGRFTVRYK
jgi:hypothetical protein